MKGYVLFEMEPWLRQTFVASHTFYIEQARKRLLCRFGHIEQEADQAANDWLEENQSRFNPDFHDPEDFMKRAEEACGEFYQRLMDMRRQTYLSVTAGMFHEWDKQLRQWLVEQIEHWPAGGYAAGKNVYEEVWRKPLDDIGTLLQKTGLMEKDTDFWPAIKRCNCVVNAYKHGRGRSLRELRCAYPEYLHDAVDHKINDPGDPLYDPNYLDYTHLRVTDAQLQVFSDAIIAFWQAIPAQVVDTDGTEIPEWFAEAMQREKDAADSDEVSR